MMTSHRRYATYLIIAVALTLAVVQAAVAQIRKPVGEYGYVDWEHQRVVAYGMGVAPAETRNVAQRRALAGRAATVDARRNLLEVVKGVQIDSLTRVADMVVTSDLILTRVTGLLEGSIVDENIYQSDGSARAQVSIALTGAMAKLLLAYHPAPPAPAPPPPVLPAVSDDPAHKARLQQLDQLDARVTALEEMIGRLVDLNLRKETQPAHAPPAQITQELQALNERLTALEQQKSLTPESSKETSTFSKEPPVALPGYTSLVIDARNQLFQPSLRPSLYGEGHLLYPTAAVNPDIAVANGYVRYFRDLGQAQQSPLAGALPFTARTLGLYNSRQSDLMLNPEDARVIMALLQQPADFLQNCRVLIVF